MKACAGDAEVSFAAPTFVRSVDDCHFYHVMDLPDGRTIEHDGSWDLRDRYDEYIGGVDLADKSVLDVGPASGFISFEAERRGAREVIGFDYDEPSRINILPYVRRPKRATAFFLQQRRNSYWYAHSAYKSKAKMVYGDIYRLSEQVPPADIVLLAQILVHLERPLTAMAQAGAVAKEKLIIVDGSFDDDRPTSVFLGGHGNFYSWYHHSVGFYRTFLPIIGFELMSATVGVYKTNHRHVTPLQQVWTFVAERRDEKATEPWT